MKFILHYVRQFSAFTGYRLYLNLLAMVAISLLDGIGSLMLIPMLSVSGLIGVDISVNQMTRLLSFLNRFPVTISLVILLGIYITVSLGQNVLQRLSSLQNVHIHQKFITHLRFRIHRALILANWRFYLQRRNSDIINTLTNELPRVSSGVYLFFQTITTLLFTLVQIGLAFWLQPFITLIVLICGVALAMFARRYSRKAYSLGKETVNTYEAYQAGITDIFNGIKEIKTNNLGHSRLQRVHDLSQKQQREQESFNNVRTKSQLVYKMSSVLLIAGLLYLSVVLFHAQPGQLLLIIVIFSRLWPRFITMQNNMEQIFSNIPAFQKTIELEKEALKESKANTFSTELTNNTDPLELHHGITCQDVSFRYDQANSAYALKNMNLEIPANRMTAIVGRSGAGKSTLIDLIMGLIEPSEGSIRVDGKPLQNETLERFRHSISYVPQDPYLFHGTIRDNMLLFVPEATDEQIWESLELSYGAAFVRKLPSGLDTVIGDRGIKLSGGERQRIVLGRALLRKPSILILDEATSALDNENEANIQEVLHQLKGRVTILVIAHRFTTIRNADQVIVLEQGQIAQAGEYQQLAKDTKGIFKVLLGEDHASRERLQPSAFQM
ncbi:ABC transporter ATP-binding protein [Paenibacillus protaetiae]|uniref:ABC transporter ATP-binding protein n=1 Tax=Paenibacillus protaetiae TaxID=2509456 RepID=A0A4P6EX31_9BACL|nr:ABC transporter ATP-binding protein [Paenibacillus protaetiae]QAY66783.1 ABC transporter ATP-binding protein [Paenibacillus protaetiae]